jgi:flagellar export protein FliJ
MAADPLVSLVKLRQIEVDEARRALGECLAAERLASTAVQQAADAIVAEAAAAEQLAADDAAVEAFAAWLPTGRAAQRAAEDALVTAEARVAEARAALTLSRAALRAAEQMAAGRELARQAEAQRQEQFRLDEIGALRGTDKE